MVIKRWFQKLKRGLKEDVVRDYSPITKASDGLNAKLMRDSDNFCFQLIVNSREHGATDFKAPINKDCLKVLEQIVGDIKKIRKKGDRSQRMRLRFRDNEIDLLITYKYGNQMQTPRQRTAPLNGRTLKLLEEMLSDVEMLMENQFSLYDIDDDD